MLRFTCALRGVPVGAQGTQLPGGCIPRLRVTIAVGMLGTVVPEEFLPSWSSVLWRGVLSTSLADALLHVPSSEALSACDSLPQAKFSHKIHHVLALAGSGRSAVPEGRRERPSETS